MEPSDDLGRKTEEQRQEDMLLAQQKINQGSGRFFISGYGFSKAQRLSALISILPAYLLSRLSPKSWSRNTELFVVVGAYLVITVSLSIWLTIWVRKKPDSSKWHYFLG